MDAGKQLWRAIGRVVKRIEGKLWVDIQSILGCVNRGISFTSEIASLTGQTLEFVADILTIASMLDIKDADEMMAVFKE